MDPTERLQVLKRETVLLDHLQRVDVLTLSQTLTFRTQTLRGFTLKPAKGRTTSYTNRANVTAVNVTTNRLIVVHARGAVHISGEVLDGKHRSLLLLSLTESDLKASPGELSLVMGTRLLDAQDILAEPHLPVEAEAAPAAPEKRRRRRAADDATDAPAPADASRDDVTPVHAELNVHAHAADQTGIQPPSAGQDLTAAADPAAGGLQPDEPDLHDMPF
ncbi:hypothetical protein [Deinococcus ficus]|uniref:Uncharacterized protein n=1 Tax=Deinococcus ficus TaxID=317577 RepID=A0A221T2X3_9DEIO|nr:hypothetical protein [Deinococcus ficus]ASN83243.1 hypothetical protein DFI_18775 [Deinococcus ficus]